MREIFSKEPTSKQSDFYWVLVDLFLVLNGCNGEEIRGFLRQGTKGNDTSVMGNDDIAIGAWKKKEKDVIDVLKSNIEGIFADVKQLRFNEYIALMDETITTADYNSKEDPIGCRKILANRVDPYPDT
jgi:hypothetical protein